MREKNVPAREHKNEKAILETNMIDVFYPVLKSFLSRVVYRYLAAGGICFFTNFCIFHISYHFIYLKHQIRFLQLPPHFFALITSMCFTIPIGFYLNKIYVFANSSLLSKSQFIRYLLSTTAMVAISTILLDILITELHINITIAFITNVIILQLLNYFIQKNFSFKQ